MRRAIKTQTIVLIVMAMCHQERCRLDLSHECLVLACYLVNNFILTSLDDFKKYISNLATEAIPWLEMQLLSEKELCEIFWAQYEKDQRIKELFELRREKLQAERDLPNYYSRLHASK